MAELSGYDKIYNKADMGLGVGGNPHANTLINDRLDGSKDSQDRLPAGVEISPPQEPKPKKLFKKDFLNIMKQEEK